MTMKNLKWRWFIIISITVASMYFVTPPFDMSWGGTPQQGKIKLGLDLQGGMDLELRVDTSKLPDAAKQDATNRAMEIIRNRIDQFGVAEPVIQRQGPDRIVVQLPGVTDRERALDLIGKTALLEFKLVSDDDQKLKDAIAGQDIEGHHLYKDEDGRDLLVENESLLTGKAIETARVDFGQYGTPVVDLEFNKEGAQSFSEITGANVNRRLAIILDGKVQSAPVINEQIPSGRAQISGNFSPDQASDLVITLRAGALPAPIVIEQERTVGPSLGKDSVEQGLKASLVGIAGVLVFMAIYYMTMGMIANVAMLLNTLILGACLAYFHATLTVPGIAGIILTIGMNVDTNVLIFERIREELRLGKPLGPAVDAGYNRAFKAIFDGNLTALLTGIILFNFGTGPVRGFALTLMIGIMGSFFTGIFVTRTIIDLLIRTQMIKSLPMLTLLPNTPKIDFLKMRKAFYGIAIVTVIGSFVLIGTQIQKHLGIDFTGGILQEYRFEKPVAVEDVRRSLKGIGLETATIQASGDGRDLIIRTPKVEQDAVRNVIEQAFQNNSHEMIRIESVGPIVGKELRSKSLWAVVFSLLSVMAYLAMRFQFRYSAAALAAVFHDAIVCLAAVLLTGREVSIPVLAAILTTIGYQVNDTIVTFDRVRENLHKVKIRYGDLVNLSINETLSRTFLTSFSVFIAVGALYFFGGPVINDFAFTMLVGLISGTYSTIFIACPMVVDWPGQGSGALMAPKPSPVKTKPSPAKRS